MILRKLIRQIIKEPLVLEKYKEGDAMIGSLSSILKDFEESDYEKEEEFNTTASGRVPASDPDKKQANTDITNPSTPTQKDQIPLPDNTGYQDKQIKDNHIQFKEGYEVYKINRNTIGIENLISDKVNNYKIIYIAQPALTIVELKMVNSSANLTASKASLKETVVLTDLNKRNIVGGFESDANTFKVKGTTTGGQTGTVKFIKVQ